MFGIGSKYKSQLDVMTVVALSFALQKAGTPEGLARIIAYESYERELSEAEKGEFYKLYIALEERAKELARYNVAPGYTVDNGKLVKVD